MKRTAFVLIALGIAVFPFNGCTMLGMHGMGHNSARHERQPVRTLIRELQNDDATVAVEFSTFSASQESMISVSVRDTKSGQPISGADITVLIEKVERATAEGEEHREIIVSERLLEEPGEMGTSRLRHRFDRQGLYEITVKAWVSNDDMAVPPLIISITHEVAHPKSSMDHMGITSIAILGGIGMALLMIVMMGVPFH